MRTVLDHILYPVKTGKYAIVMLALMLVALGTVLSGAEAATRSLKFYNVHTKEKATITYQKNGKYLSSGLKQINNLLRDWRRNEPTKMDPKLLDLIWTVYRQSGSKDYIHIISGYRSPKTNAMLKRTRGGQATKSQHMLGKALDFYLPDVKLATLRSLGLKMHVGGVGYYPRSGSPFVHLDTGNVRHWPRMTRQQLVSVFPKGDTIHVPSDGKPLARYKETLASVNSRNRSGGGIIVQGDDKPKQKTLFAALFGGGADEEEDNSLPETPENNVPAAKPTAPAIAATPEAPTPPPVAVADPLEVVIASLPTRGPVPPSSPRRGDVPAAITPEIVDVPVIPEIPEVPAAIEPTQVEAEALIALADENVPLPTRRPAYTPSDNSAIAALAETTITPEVVPTPEVVLAALERRRPSAAAVLNATFGNQQAQEPSAVQSAFQPINPDLAAGLDIVPGQRPGLTRETFAALPQNGPTPVGKSARVTTQPLPVSQDDKRNGPIGRSVITGVQTTAKGDKLVVANLDARFAAAEPKPISNDLAAKLKLYGKKLVSSSQ